VYVWRGEERNRYRERISLLGTLRQRQCGTNVSSLKINRLLTSRYKTLHLLFMYLCDHSIFLYVRIYYAMQSALFPSAKTEPSKDCQSSLTLVMYSLYQRNHCCVPLASQQVYIPFACSFVSKKRTNRGSTRSPWTTVLLRTATVVQLVQKLPRFYGIWIH